MTMRKTYMARCDAPGCSIAVTLDPITNGERWDYGEALNDLGWQAGPNSPRTYCPQHVEADWANWEHP